MKLPKIVLWLAALALPASPAAAAPASGSTVTVQVMTGKVMRDPSYLGATVAKVVRGDHLTFQEAQKDWYKVTTAGGATGWINKSNVVDKAVQLSSRPGGDTSGGASADEVALAGRGFSPEVENSYRAQHPNLDFSHIDRIEKLSVDTEALARFAAAGKVGGGK
jgi:SH3 domain-containing protein